MSSGSIAVSDYCRGIWRTRFFWLSLVKMDLRTRYRRSMLGIGWSLLHPVAMTIVLCTIFSKLFGQPWREYGPYVLSGMALWNYFAGVTVDGCQSFLQGESYIRQHPAPLAIYPLRTTLSAGFHFLLALVVVLVFTWCVHGFGNLPALTALLPVLLLLFVFGWAVSCCVSILNVMFQDTQHLVMVAMQILFYITPVFYPAEMLRERNLAWIVDYNPLAGFMEMIRQPVLTGQLPIFPGVGLAVATTVFVSLIATIGLARMQQRLIFHL